MEAQPTPLPISLPPTPALLDTAEARLRRRQAYARPLAGRGGRALAAGLATARAALQGVLAPGALWRPLAGGEAAGLEPPALIWLSTLGEDHDALQAALEGDRMLTHLAGDLAREALFAAARSVRSGLAERHPGQRLVHHALRDAEGTRWDAAAVAGLLPLFGPAPLGVTAPEGGALSPAHTLIGLAALRD